MLPTAALLLFSQLRAHDGVADASPPPSVAWWRWSRGPRPADQRRLRRQRRAPRPPAGARPGAARGRDLARVDVICLDKTGTITAGDIAFSDLEVLGEAAATVASALAGLAASDLAPRPSPPPSAGPRWSPGRGGRHLGRPGGGPVLVGPQVESGPTSPPRGTWLLGAPEASSATAPTKLGATCRGASRGPASAGAWCCSAGPTIGSAVTTCPGLVPQALVLLADQVRPDAAETLAYFVAQDVRVKVIGDNRRPSPGGREAGSRRRRGRRRRDLPEDPAALADVVDAPRVRRVQPHKQAMVGPPGQRASWP